MSIKKPKVKGKTVAKLAGVAAVAVPLFFAFGWGPCVDFAKGQGWVSEDKAQELKEDKDKYRDQVAEGVKKGAEKIAANTNAEGIVVVKIPKAE